MRTYLVMTVAVVMLLATGCASPSIKLFTDATEPLEEFTLEGTESGKVLVIPVRGVISDAPKRGAFREMPSVVEEVVSQLRLAEEDFEVKAVLLKIDSPGGSTTASDLLYHEIRSFKERTGVKVVVAMMDLGTSGGYYISLAADYIMAHPTTITGSIGVIFMRPALTGFMKKIGVAVEVDKSGENKDMGSPFRETTEKEEAILEALTEALGKRFHSLVAAHRKIDQNTLSQIATGRVYLAEEAVELGLVDEIGYLNDAVSRARTLADLPAQCKVIVYRRSEYPDDNLYNTSTMQAAETPFPLIDLGLPQALSSLSPGFYYLWFPLAQRQ